MQHAKLLALLVAGIVCGGCSNNLTCDKPQAYQFASEAEKVKAPEGLDDLPESREMRIPRASPQDPRSSDAPCLDLPPTIQASGSN